MKKSWKQYFFMLSVAALCLSAVAGQALAQDPLEVGPHVYKLIFENERVRVLDLHFNPGDKIEMHSHPDHFVYLLTGGKLVLSYPDGSTKEFAGEPGQVIWIGAESHAAENIGGTEVKAVVVELKEPAQTA